MADVHDHSHDLGTAPEVARLLRLAVLLVIVLKAIGLFIWRPDGGIAIPEAVDGQGQRVEATVTGTAEVNCAGTDVTGAPIVCTEIQLDITSGPNDGSTGGFELYPQAGSPEFDAGDRIVVNEYEVPDGSNRKST